MKKFLIAIVVTICVLTLYMCVGHAEEPEERIVTIEDAITVADQLSEYETEIEMLAKLIWSEARGVKSTAEKAAVAWCVLNRVDHEKYPDTISEVIKQRSQFAYKNNLRITNQELYDELYGISKDVIMRWLFEKQGIENVGRVLPEDYIFFAGRRGRNWFRSSYRARGYWDWSLESPYEADN